MPDRQSSIDKQIGWLETAVNNNKQIEAYALWIRLVGVMASMGTEIESMALGLRGDGNGTKGALHRIGTIEGAMKAMQSDIREMRNLVRIALGLEHDPEVLGKMPRFSKEEHPGRRADDDKTMSDKLLGYFVRYILPPLIVSAILAAVGFWVAVNNHLIISV